MNATIAVKAGRTSLSRDWLACACILLLTALVYLPAFSNSFVNFDDHKYVSKNEAVRAGLTINSLVYAWTTVDMGNWIPLTWMSYELDTTLFGTSASSYIFTNIVLHIANALLLYAFLRVSTGLIGPSLVTASLFAVHPLHVESVAWIAERKDVLSTFFLFLTLLGWLLYCEKPGWQRYLIVVVTFVLGMLAKPMLVTLPVLLVLLDYWPLGRFSQESSWTKLVTEKFPLLIISLLFGLITIFAQADTGALVSTEQLPLRKRLNTAITGIGNILVKTFLPTGLTAYYPGDSNLNVGMAWVLPFLVLLVITIVAVCLRRRMPYLLMGWLWFLISILPVSGLIQVGFQAYADRYSYIPHIGLFIALVWMVFSIRQAGKLVPALKWGTAIIATAALSVLTIIQVSYWKNETTLWTHAVNVNEANWMAHFHLGKVLHVEGRSQEGLAHLIRAEELQGGIQDTYDALAAVYAAVGNNQKAIDSAIKALMLNPGNMSPRMRLVGLLTVSKKYDEARAVLKDGLIYAPNDPQLELSLGQLALETRNFPEALEHLVRANQLQRGDIGVQTMIAVCLVELKRIPEAIEQLKAIIQQSPRDADTRLNLAMLYSEQGDKASAIQQVQQILNFDRFNQEAIQLLKTLQDSPSPPKP